MTTTTTTITSTDITTNKLVVQNKQIVDVCLLSISLAYIILMGNI